jgi:hypothetical protein
MPSNKKREIGIEKTASTKLMCPLSTIWSIGETLRINISARPSIKKPHASRYVLALRNKFTAYPKARVCRAREIR